jgi:SAM-dependent methyltransferase
MECLMHKMYHALAAWWPLLSPPEDYADEAAFFLSLLVEVTGSRSASLLELGSGGGNNAMHIKPAFASVTLTDRSPDMLDVSRRLNPDCEHIAGDMRTIRLGRTFDVVFTHDAIDYMTTEADVRAAIETALIHCKPGGMALFVPDAVRETLETTTEHGGTDGDGRALRYLEWSYDPDPNDHTIVTDYVLLTRKDGEDSVITHERHLLGLFTIEEWLRLLSAAGFHASVVIDKYERHVFVGRKPAA